MTIIYTLLGVPYVAVIDSVRGIVLQKAARKRIPSPGQMSLFAGNEPKQGDTKVEGGITYQLNQHSRWERVDKAKGKKAKAKAVVPVVEEKAESKAKAKSKPSGIADMRQKGDTGSRRDEKPAMQTQHFSSYDEVKAGLFERISFPVRINKNRNETFSIYPHPKGADKYWSQTELLELANVLRSVGVNPPRLEKSWDDYIEKIKAGPNKGGYIPHNDGFTYMSLGQPPTHAASQVEPEAISVEDEATPVAAEVVDMVNEDLDTPEALPEPTIGDMLAEQEAREEPGEMEKISGRDFAYKVAEKIPSIYSKTAGNLKASVWTKKDDETRIYLKTWKGKDAGHISIRHSDGYIKDYSNWSDIESQVDQLLDTMLEQYEISPGSQNTSSSASAPTLPLDDVPTKQNEKMLEELAAMSRKEIEAKIRDWRDEMDDAGKYEDAVRMEKEIAKALNLPNDIVGGSGIVLKMIPENIVRELAVRLFSR